MPYRKIAEMPFYEKVTVQPKKPWRFRYPRLWWILTWVFGAMMVPLAGFVIWVVTVGCYRFGGWVSNDIFGWDIKDIYDGPQRWLLGVSYFLAIGVFVFGARPIGKIVMRCLGFQGVDE